MAEKPRQPGEELFTIPQARSRAGDFLFCAMAGVMAIVMTLMVSGTVVALVIVVSAFLGVLGLRFLLLKDVPAVRVGTDVTEEQLKLLERLRALLDALPQPVMLLTAEGRIEMCNRAVTDMFGENTNGRHISSVVRAPQALEALRTVENTGEPFETELTFTGAQERTSLFYAAPLGRGPDAGTGAMIVMLRDRTEQKRLERMRTDFVANASHELRTPLASMAGFIETLQGHARNDPVARERFLEVMAAQASRMLRLVEDLIGLSAIELNEAKPLTDTINLREVTASVVETLQPIAEVEGGELVFKAGEGAPAIRGDRHEIFRLLQNLCDNSLKYGLAPDKDATRVEVAVGFGIPEEQPGFIRTGDSPSQIAVRAGIAEKDLIHIKISDRGEGIEPNDLPRLTERFYRVNPQTSRAKGGTGLGLAIVKHILQRHRGGLQVESKLGEGAVFTVFLPPLRESDLPGDPVRDTQEAH